VLSLFDVDLIPSELDEWMKKQRIVYKKDRGNKRRRAKFDLLKGIGFQFEWGLWYRNPSEKSIDKAKK